jgi:hypothetical protein
MANSYTVRCSRCQTALSPEHYNTPAPVRCPRCQSALEVAVFPALFRGLEAGKEGEVITAAGEASCFYHSEKQAARACDGCGRFLCDLCDLPLAGQHFCPNCIESGQRKGRLKPLERQRILHDRLALAVAIWPILMWPFTCITAPCAIYLAIRHWNSPLSIVGGTKIRFVLAILLGLAQVAGWAVGLYVLFSS